MRMASNTLLTEPTPAGGYAPAHSTSVHRSSKILNAFIGSPANKPAAMSSKVKSFCISAYENIKETAALYFSQRDTGGRLAWKPLVRFPRWTQHKEQPVLSTATNPLPGEET